jgi:serine/threonine protein kinase/tetratricopeptide (TPR) repeat protein
MIGQTVSHYKILEKLGEGGMGIVYKAQDTKLERTVALKFLPSELTRDAEAKERFIHEAKAASALNHPNICSIHIIEEFEDQQFIDMEYVEGETLKKSIVIGLPANLSAKVMQSRTSAEVPRSGTKAGHLSFENCLDIAIQIGEGLNAAHKKGIVHRDIKPDNIMLTDEGLVKIMDFGLAKLKGVSKLTKTHSTLGTLSYMSPEQARGEDVDQRSDIFSFGAVLYEMITGRRPFKGEHEAAIIYSLVNETPEPLARYKSDIPGELQRVVDKALSKDKGERYQHVDEMVSDLRRVHHTISGGVKSETKKSKLPWIVTAIVVILIAVGIYLFYPKSTSTSERSKSIAVLPFKNLSDSKEDEFFSDGLTDDIITQLSKIRGIEKVIARTSVMRYKGTDKSIRDIGKELDVTTVLEGSVRRAGNQIRVVAQLIDVQNEGHLWADTYDKEMTQVFAIQSDIAQQIATALEAKISPTVKNRIEKKQTENTEAYQLYLKGRFYWNKRVLDDVKTAIDCFKQAIEKDPDYALAYAGLASAYVLIPAYGFPPGDWYSKGQSSAFKALEIDSTLAEAHTVLGEIAQDRYYDWEGAEKHFRRAIELDPGYPTAHQWYAVTLGLLGRSNEALLEAKRAQELDPLSLIIILNLGDVLYYMRQYELAIEQFKNTMALDYNFPWAHSSLAGVYQLQGRFDEAIKENKEAHRLGGNIPYTLAPIGWVYAQAGRKADALRVLEDLIKLSQQGINIAYGIGILYYELGEKDKAFEWLEKSYQDREIWLEVLALDPLFDDLRSDLRCIAILKKMGLRK